ncbi:MAG: hypothetical protein KGL35_20600 [Bradyrhizobium sp.]|nr:hypothetical protein [Pseudomonadota bacterium]MDE2471074.1 hypothetical protein [Bradyrhizobium sp.]
MADQNPNDLSAQKEGSEQEIAERKAQKEKRKKGGTDTIKTVEGGSIADGGPFDIFPRGSGTG